MPHSLDIL